MTGDLLTDLKLSVEFETAKLSLMATQKPTDLIAVWWRDCDHFQGEPRRELQKVYAEKLRSFGAMAA